MRWMSGFLVKCRVIFRTWVQLILTDIRRTCGFYLLLASHTPDKVSNGIFSSLMLIGLLLATCPKFVLFTQFIVIFSLGLQKDSGDARASSFLKIIELIPQTSQPPLMLFVENVVGFEVRCWNLLYLSAGFIWYVINWSTNNIIFYQFFLIFLTLYLSSDIWYTQPNAGHVGSKSFYNTRVHFESFAVRRAIF